MKPELGKYVGYASLILVLILLVAVAVGYWFQWQALRVEIAVGIFLGYLNAIVGYLILVWGMKRSQNAFMGAVFGGMIFRFLLLFAILFILIIAVHFRMIPLIISLLFSYFTFLFFEIMFVNKYTTQD